MSSNAYFRKINIHKILFTIDGRVFSTRGEGAPSRVTFLHAYLISVLPCGSARIGSVFMSSPNEGPSTNSAFKRNDFL